MNDNTLIFSFFNKFKFYSLDIKTSVNVCAPTIHNDFPSAHIDNLRGIFDEYVTEWNPLRWNQDISVIKRTIKYAKKSTHKKIYHATTCTGKNGIIYSVNSLTNIFNAIVISGATPRLGIAFNEKGLDKIREAMDIAYSK